MHLSPSLPFSSFPRFISLSPSHCTLYMCAGRVWMKHSIPNDITWILRLLADNVLCKMCQTIYMTDQGQFIRCMNHHHHSVRPFGSCFWDFWFGTCVWNGNYSFTFSTECVRVRVCECVLQFNFESRALRYVRAAISLVNTEFIHCTISCHGIICIPFLFSGKTSFVICCIDSAQNSAHRSLYKWNFFCTLTNFFLKLHF